jgi:hypothetical protein
MSPSRLATIGGTLTFAFEQAEENSGAGVADGVAVFAQLRGEGVAVDGVASFDELLMGDTGRWEQHSDLFRYRHWFLIVGLIGCLVSGGMVDETLINPVVIFGGLVGAIMWNLMTGLSGCPPVPRTRSSAV